VLYRKTYEDHPTGRPTDQPIKQTSMQITRTAQSSAAEVSAEVTAEVKLAAERLGELIVFCSSPRSRREMQVFCGIKSDEYFRKNIVIPMLASRLVKKTIPDKPNSRNQKYVKS